MTFTPKPYISQLINLDPQTAFYLDGDKQAIITDLQRVDRAIIKGLTTGQFHEANLLKLMYTVPKAEGLDSVILGRPGIGTWFEFTLVELPHGRREWVQTDGSSKAKASILNTFVNTWPLYTREEVI